MRLKKVTVLICGLLFLGGSAFLVCERNRYNVVSHEELLAIRQKLKVLSPQEKQDLSFFIDQIISFDQYPYTLVDYKPMSICNIALEDTEDVSDFSREALKRSKYQILKRGYLVWEKYQSLFPRKKHILIDYPFLEKGKKEIALIYSKLCMSTIHKYLDDFQKILEKRYTSEEVFWILTHPEHNDFYIIIDNVHLVGILLGFGRNNAYLYEQHLGTSSRSDTKNQQPKRYPVHLFSNEWPWPGRLLAPNFVCDPTTKETQQLKKHYKKARRIVCSTYFFRNRLEVTLALLMQN
jgi:hypothetical protein